MLGTRNVDRWPRLWPRPLPNQPPSDSCFLRFRSGLSRFKQSHPLFFPNLFTCRCCSSGTSHFCLVTLTLFSACSTRCLVPSAWSERQIIVAHVHSDYT